MNISTQSIHMEELIYRLFEYMKRESNRLISYQACPKWSTKGVSPVELARAGFFYSLRGDKVICAFCRGCLDGWKPEDDPFYRHTITFLFCPYVTGVDIGNEPIRDHPSLPLIRFPKPIYDTVIHSQSPSDMAVPYALPDNKASEPSSIPENIICKICRSNTIEVFFLPCGHSLSCRTCSKRLISCPYCRAQVCARHRLYLIWRLICLFIKFIVI